MKKKSEVYIRKLAITGALGALVAFLGITRLGFFPWFSGVTITVLHIPAIIGAILEGPVVGAGVGAIFGIFSLIQAYLSPMSPFDIAFQNPLVSILPRMLFPVAAWGIYQLISGGGKQRLILSVIISSVLATFVHTLLVLGMLILTNGAGILPAAPGNPVWAFIGGVLIANGIPEALVAAILTTLVTAAWLGTASAVKKSKLSREVEKIEKTEEE
ncbi:ECF transporter S component [Brucepastera parasyntrophica]|uniref:ECF transporter S component n=1 Tax=Brucepastera parasyntrophica TaxID=2880008 RepID=UPI00210EA38F|nr:ECF transporter S component [Brucepastera parasyntrophica]ULQ59064.1 ECF transporter S component [Brucepastera parasyntrophica]